MNTDTDAPSTKANVTRARMIRIRTGMWRRLKSLTATITNEGTMLFATYNKCVAIRTPAIQAQRFLVRTEMFFRAGGNNRNS